MSTLESKLRKIQENEVKLQPKTYAFLQVDHARRGIKFINLNCKFFDFLIFKNKKYHRVLDFIKWPLKEVKCKICIFGVDLVFYMKIEQMPPAKHTSSLERHILKLLPKKKEITLIRTHSDRSIDETSRRNFIFQFTQHHLQFKLNKSMELKLNPITPFGRRLRDGLSVISFEGHPLNQTIIQFESEEGGPKQRREPTIKTDVRTESEWYGFIPSKEVTCEKGSEERRQDNEDTIKFKERGESMKMELGKRSFKEVVSVHQREHSLKDKTMSHNSPKIRFLNNPAPGKGKLIPSNSRSEKETKTKKHSNGKCVICHEPENCIRGVLDCDHSYCFTCIKKWLSKSLSCPICKIHPRLIRKFKNKQFVSSEFTRQWRDPRLHLPIQVRGRSRWVFHETGSENEGVDFNCQKCHQIGDISTMVQCIRCQVKACHMDCLWLNSRELPDYQWFCDDCVRSRPNRRSYSRRVF